MTVAIIKYNAGNTFSVQQAMNRLGATTLITDDAEAISAADKVIFPGVGEASTAMKYLKDRNLDTLLLQLTQPVLGICLGMQLMCTHSEEGDTPTLRLFQPRVQRFLSQNDKVPHMGWNTVISNNNPLFNAIAPDAYFYFVHSYYASISPDTIASCQYAQTTFSAALHKNNFYGVQFHPEKSGDAGIQLLRNFLTL